MNSSAYCIGIDIGGTYTKLGIVDSGGGIIEHFQIPTSAYKRHTDFILEVQRILTPFIDKFGKSNCLGIGVGAPNAHYYTGNIEYPVNLNWKGIIPFGNDLEQVMQLPVKITNDANAAAMGEHKLGAAQPFAHCIVITLGTGVGAGIIIQNELLLGKDGLAGELGHTIVLPGGRYHPGSGLSGTLEAYCSAPGVVRTALEKLEQVGYTSLLSQWGTDEITSKHISECAQQGDKLCLDVFEETGGLLGMAMANFAHFSSPEAFIFFGGLSGAGNLLLNPARKSMEAHLLEVYKNKIQVLPGALPESDAAILGAAALVMV
ncbi:MAG TPA: ROK family protein [Ferruginibacter sp.]|nr:ROK family protein [Ferruginibacter sp.]HRO17102.1 ROK family protein [Ferruginibacter sp.]